jgi:hypothetical protein
MATEQVANGRSAEPTELANADDEWRPFTPTLHDDTAALRRIAEVLADVLDEERGEVLQQEIERVRTTDPEALHYLAALLILRDLALAGWSLRCSSGAIHVRPHDSSGTPGKRSVRNQLLSGRRDQLANSAVRRFVAELERPPAGRDSILNLIADGGRLAEVLRPVAAMPRGERAAVLRTLCRPYLVLAERGTRDPETGIDLYDIWRYFRHTWSSRYRRPPGRSLAFLVRDAAQPRHPVMGIAALSNGVLQLPARDEWVGWSAKSLLESVQRGEVTEAELVHALRERIRLDLSALYTEDLGFREGEPPCFDDETDRRLSQLAQSAQKARVEGLRESRADRSGAAHDFIALARTPLFVAKRAATARSLLRAAARLAGLVPPLSAAFADPEISWAVGFALRRLRQHFMSSSVMEISTCGAVPPYGHLLAGKLVSLMMMSPAVAHAYRERYNGEPSIIASQMAGRPIVKDADLVLLGTTSLYSERSSQYNRVVLPSGAVHGTSTEVRFIEVGRSGGHGSSNLSAETEDALAELAAAKREFRNVNFMFGEGQSPKLRQTREGLEALGLGEADIIRHGSPRVVYVVPLATNARRFLLGIDPVGRPALPKEDLAVEAIAEHWRTRWLASRLDHAPALQALGALRAEDSLLSREWDSTATGQRRLL